MELLKAIGDIYNAIPDPFWHHWLSFIGSLMGALIEKPVGLMGWLRHLLFSYVAGFYGYGAVSVPIKGYIPSADVETTRNIGHIVMALIGSPIIMFIYGLAKNYKGNQLPPPPSGEAKPD